jgi:hypothetical protein
MGGEESRIDLHNPSGNGAGPYAIRWDWLRALRRGRCGEESEPTCVQSSILIGRLSRLGHLDAM